MNAILISWFAASDERPHLQLAIAALLQITGAYSISGKCLAFVCHVALNAGAGYLCAARPSPPCAPGGGGLGFVHASLALAKPAITSYRS
jgi:hypothetical protein